MNLKIIQEIIENAEKKGFGRDGKYNLDSYEVVVRLIAHPETASGNKIVYPYLFDKEELK